MIAQLVKNPPTMHEPPVRSLGWEDPPEKGKATHCSILAWRIPWTVSSMGLQRGGRDSATSLSLRFEYFSGCVALSCGTQDLPCSECDGSLQGTGVSGSVIASHWLSFSTACGIIAL